MLTYQQIMELPAGAQIFKVTGTLVELYGPKTGSNSKGDWALQRGTLQFDDGKKLPLFFKDRDPLHLSCKGRRIELSCTQGSKGLSGVYADDDDHGDTVKRQIKITPTGDLSFVDGGQSQQRHEEPPPRQQQPPPPQERQAQQPPARTQQQPPASNTPPAQKAAPGSTAAMNECAARCNQIANLQILCMGTVENYVVPTVEAKTGRKVSDAERSGLTMNMVIEMMRSGEAWKLPAVRFGTKQANPPPPQQPPAGGGERDPNTGEFVF